MEKIKVLFAGESWFFTKTETKGVDQFTVGGYETEIGRVREYMKDFAEITHIPAHMVPYEFPDTKEKLAQYDAVLISDVGSNTFYLHPDTFFSSKTTPDLMEVIKEYVEEGGAFGMIGGYMTFMGIEGKGRWGGTKVEEILPVTMEAGDDRVERPSGAVIHIDPASHPILEGLDETWSPLLGYNRLKAKEGGQVLVSYEGDPILTIGYYGKGKTFAWASDCVPHWMPEEFCKSECNRRLWKNLLSWAAGR